MAEVTQRPTGNRLFSLHETLKTSKICTAVLGLAGAVGFLHNSQYGAVGWIGLERVDDTRMFSLLEWWRLSSPVTVTGGGTRLSWRCWTPACPGQVGNESLGLLCFCTWLSLYLLNCLHLNPWISSLLPSLLILSSIPLAGSEWVAVQGLIAGWC